MAYLQLLRLPNLVTAIADILAAGLIATLGMASTMLWPPLMKLCLVSCMLYAGGVVINDIIDAVIDGKERPERPIPSGAIGILEAKLIAVALFTSGIGIAYAVNNASLFIALVLIFLIFVYNCWAKKWENRRAVLMGLCRSLNFCLGLSVIPQAISSYICLAVLSFMHVMAITILSSGEVAVLPPSRIFHATILLSFSFIGLMIVGIIQARSSAYLGFVAIYGFICARGLAPVISRPQPSHVRQAVKYGILALILLDASLVAIFGHILAAVTICSLIIVPGVLSRWIYMT